MTNSQVSQLFLQKFYGQLENWDFVETLVKGLAENEQSLGLVNISKSIEVEALQVVFSFLPAENIPEFLQMIDQNSPDEILDWLEERVVGISDRIASRLGKTKVALLSL